MAFIAVAYYTVNTPYEQEIQNLVKSLKQFNMDYYIHGVESRGSWVENCAIKPEFILEMIERFKNQDILYIDSDGIVRQYPALFDNFQGDIGVHYRKGIELLSNSIFIRNSEKVKKLILRWISLQRSYPKRWDQRVLQEVINLYVDKLEIKVVDIPANYSQIFDTMKDEGNPIIEHFQASRRFKSIVSRNKQS